MGIVRRVLEWPIGSRRREYGWYAFLSLLVGVYLALWSVWPEGDAPLGFELGVLAVGLIVLFECGVEATRVQRELFFKLLRMFDTYWLLASLVVFDVSSVWAMHATVPLLPLTVSICVMTATTCIFIFYDAGIAHGLPPLIATCMPALAAANIARGVFVRLAHLDDTYVPSTFCWIGARDNAPGSHCVDSDGLTQGSQLALFLFFAKAAALAGWSLRTKQPMICTTLSADLKCELGPLCFPPTRPKPAGGAAAASGAGGGKGGREAVADAMLAEAATMLPGMGKLRYAPRPRPAAAATESAADAASAAPPPLPPPPPPLPPDVPGPGSPSSAGTVNLSMKKKLPPLGGGGGGMLGAAALPSKAPTSLAPVSSGRGVAAVPRSGRGRGGAVQLGSSTPTAVSISAGVAVAPVPSPSHRAAQEEKTAAVTSPAAAMQRALQPQMQPAQAPAAHVSIAVHPAVCSITVAALSPSPPSSPISPSPTARLLPASSAASTRAMADAMSAASPSSTATTSSPPSDASPTSGSTAATAATAPPPKPANNAARPQGGVVARERERVQYLMLDPVPNKLYINPAPKLQVIFRSLFPKWRIVASVRALVWAHAKSFYALLVAGMLATIASLDEGAWGWGFSPSARGVAVAINAVVMLFWLSIELTRADKRLLLRLCQNFTYWYLLALGLLYCGLGLYSYVFIGPGQAGYSEADTDWSYSGVTFIWLWVWWLWAVSLDSLVGLSPRLKQLLLLAIVANNLRLLVRQLFLADGFPNESLCLFQCSETRAFGVNSLVTITAFLMRSLLRAWRHPERLTLISMSVDHSMLRHRLAAKDRPAEAAASSAYVLDGEKAPALARGGGGGSRVAPHPGHGSSAQPQRAPDLQHQQPPPKQQQPQQARPAHSPPVATLAPPSPSGPQPVAVAAVDGHERKAGHRSQRTTSRRRERESARPPSAAQRAAAQPTA
jgi:hypothetical protein